MMMALKLLN